MREEHWCLVDKNSCTENKHIVCFNVTYTQYSICFSFNFPLNQCRNFYFYRHFILDYTTKFVSVSLFSSLLVFLFFIYVFFDFLSYIMIDSSIQHCGAKIHDKITSISTNQPRNNKHTTKYVTNGMASRSKHARFLNTKNKHTTFILYRSLSTSPFPSHSQFKLCSKILWSGIKYKIHLCILRIINAALYNICDKCDK